MRKPKSQRMRVVINKRGMTKETYESIKSIHVESVMLVAIKSKNGKDAHAKTLGTATKNVKKIIGQSTRKNARQRNRLRKRNVLNSNSNRVRTHFVHQASNLFK